ncbi:DUF4493 domain-containing protein [Flammeovirga sp. SubArs3]|uniref:DUF4493 domain-containing protein n=1 Tax=Flammeovirga sp. SubArs3 TaxID=2995316 RepID=UPI00248B4206|nr:DUF4493 domain-containing protein [Flammeovirga sp. SubArs3]
MMTIFRSVVFFIITTLAISCKQTEVDEIDLQGTLTFDIEINPMGNQRIIEDTIDKKDFTIVIKDDSGNIIHELNNFTGTPTSLQLPEGDYSMLAYLGESMFGFDTPFYSGSSDFSITPSETTSLSVTCTLENVKLELFFSDSIKLQYPSIYVQLKSGNDSIIYANDEIQGLYFSEGEIELKIIYDEDNTNDFMVKTMSTEANDYYKIFLSFTDESILDDLDKIDQNISYQTIHLDKNWQYPIINLLSGNNGEKKWVLDKSTFGHVGIGPSSENEPTWLKINAYEFDEYGVYDDNFLFDPSNKSFILENNGSSLVFGDEKNKEYYEQLGGINQGEKLNYISYKINPINTEDWKWSLSKHEERLYLELTGGAYPIIHSTINENKYEILLLNENELTLKITSNNGDFSHFITFLEEGYERPDVNETVRQSLYDIYDNFGGVNWTKTHDFNSSKPVREWRNVVVNNEGKLVELHLNDMGLAGNLNELVDFRDFPDLLILDMSQNQLSGELPSSLSELKSINKINLSSNGFSGGIPDKWESLIELGTLKLNSNQLTGDIPNYLNDFEDLWILKLENNNFSGVILKELFDKLTGYAPWNEFTYDDQNNPYEN